MPLRRSVQSDHAVVRGVGGEDVLAEEVDRQERGDPDVDQRRDEGDDERRAREDLVPERPAQTEHPLHGVPPDRDRSPADTAAGPLVGQVAEVVDPGPLAHRLASR
jgi:hypothetical protein